MKISHEIGRKLMFVELYDGDVFIFEQKYYMKISPINCSGNATIYNAVRLEEGETCRFTEETEVFLVDAELRIKS
jgi:hypothetical protein